MYIPLEIYTSLLLLFVFVIFNRVRVISNQKMVF